MLGLRLVFDLELDFCFCDGALNLLEKLARWGGGAMSGTEKERAAPGGGRYPEGGSVGLTQGPQMSANWSQAGSHFPYLIASLHFAGHFGTQGPQRELNLSQLGSHWPDLMASLHRLGHVGAGVVVVLRVVVVVLLVVVVVLLVVVGRGGAGVL